MENKSASRRKRSTASERLQILEAFRRSGLTQKEFARQKGIGLSTFHAWLGKSRRQDDQPSFIAAPNLFAGAAVAHFRFNFSGGLSLEVHAGFRPEELAALLQVAKAV